MVISKKHRYAFVALARTGSKAMRHFLQTKYAGEQYKKHHHMSVPPFADQFFLFTLVRNPFARMLSLYEMVSIKTGKRLPRTFRDFLQWIDTEGATKTRLPQATCLKKCNRTPDAILKIERINEELSRLPFVHVKHDFPHKRKPGNPLRFEDHYTDETIDLVLKHSAVDFDQFGYRRELPADNYSE